VPKPNGLYHVALKKRGDTVIVQMRHDVDDLDPDVWRYIGPRQVTKAHVMRHGLAMLLAVNADYGTSFKHLRVD
jgi:hypothetical protein